MARLEWDKIGEHFYERGVDHGALFVQNNDGTYADGVPWNGLTTVTESPSGAEATPVYADNIKYLNLKSAEEFGATIEALSYPPEFSVCDGSAEAEPGVFVGQQGRRSFGFVWRSLIGTDTNDDAGYKLHLAWNLDAAPSEKSHNTVNDSPEASPFSWTVTSTAVAVGDGATFKPTAKMTIDSTQVDAAALADLEDELFGTAGSDPRLPTPAEVIAFFTGAGPTEVNLALAANQPTFNNGTGVVTIPVVAGVYWTVDGVEVAEGAQPAIAVGEQSVVEAHADPGYDLEGDNDWTFQRI
jgi:hypothetical protein